MTTLSISRPLATHREPHHEDEPDSPGGDVLRRYPTLPDDVFQRAIQQAEIREKARDTLGDLRLPTRSSSNASRTR